MALVSKAFGDIITFTRASTGTFVGSNGLIQSAAIDAPRFDYDPVTLAAKGLLIEESRANLHLYSQDFSTGWSNNNPSDATLTAAAAAGLDGTTTAGSYLCSTTADVARRFWPAANITVTTSTVYTASIYVKPVNGWTWVGFAISGGVAFTGGGGGARFNLATGAQGGTQSFADGSYVSSSITSVGNGWYRLVVSANVGSTANIRPKLNLLDADESIVNPAVGVIGAGIYVWGAQLEAGDFPTSYIPTTTTSLTRSADSALINTLSPWFNATEGTLYGQFDSVASGTRTVTAINDGTSNESIRLRTISTDPFFTVTDGGVDQANIDAGTVASYTSYKFAGAYKANDFATCINGGTVQTDTSGTLPTVTQMMLGTSAATNYLNGHLQRVTYYPRRLSDGELQTITT